MTCFANVNCPGCGAEHRAERDEDGYPEIPVQPCSDPECKAWLCECCSSWRCDICREVFCEKHAVFTLSGENLCGGCYLAARGVPVLDYEDGGELRCGVCRKACASHYRFNGQVDVGECCAFARRAA